MVDIYRKPTHTDRYLDFHSHHDRKHKISIAETLLHRALNLPNTQVGKTRETARVCAALHSNGYPIKIAADVIKKESEISTTYTYTRRVGSVCSLNGLNQQTDAALQSLPTSKASQESSRNMTSKSPADRKKLYNSISLSLGFDLPKTTSATATLRSSTKRTTRSRKTLESWHKAKTIGANNNSSPLPRQYHILLNKH